MAAEIFFLRLPLPASVRPFLPLSSSFMSSFSAPLIIHSPEPSLGASLSFLLRLRLWHLAAASLRPATVHRRRLSSPNLPLLPPPSLPLSHFPPFSLCLLWFVSPANALLLHYITVHPPSLPPSLPLLLTHSSPALPQTDREEMGETVCEAETGDRQRGGCETEGGRGCKRRWEEENEQQHWCKPLLSPSNTRRALLWAHLNETKTKRKPEADLCYKLKRFQFSRFHVLFHFILNLLYLKLSDDYFWWILKDVCL